jgi:surfactin synthase thioesterase subunit
MGTLMGFLLVKRILNEDLPQPIHLFFSGRGGPSVQDKDKHIHALPKKEFIKKLQEYEGSPQEILNDESIMEFFEPVLRADFKAVSNYPYNEDTPFNIPITVMIGTTENTTYEEAMTWQDETSKKISLQQFPGGHFFIYQHSQEIGRIFSHTLQHFLEIISD